MKDIKQYLSNNNYPGRGIIIGQTSDTTNTVIAYFIMGRSVNSRNRVFFECENGIKTKAFDESKLTDPSLIIYAPVRIYNDTTIVTNGDQTDTVYDYLKNNKTFVEALRTREYEPDMPNYTPRISGIVCNKSGAYKLSILKYFNNTCQRNFYEYSPVNGSGHIIHTYETDGDPIPSFNGEPVPVKIENCIEDYSKEIWNSLNSENKVSLFVRYINNTTGELKTKIYNKLEGDI
ncbi:IMP cyclohydrolase [Eubacteriales bacterium OttesenSCG-928-G02]|nr:IMP cyclohydrolase [Eubacteriales bacterium OttesenSCG-928-G02]